MAESNDLEIALDRAEKAIRSIRESDSRPQRTYIQKDDHFSFSVPSSPSRNASHPPTSESKKR